MPQTRLAPDAFGVVTICLVALLILLGLLCIIYSFYFRSHVHRRDFVKLSYFNGPWIIRISLVLFVIWWGLGEIARLSLLRHKGRLFNALDPKWQENLCKCYIVSNLGFAEPCLFLTLVFLLRAPLQKMESGTLGGKWNWKTAGYILLYCLPVFVLQILVISVGPRFTKTNSSLRRLPHYFTRTVSHVVQDQGSVSLCTYPLLSTIILGLFTTILTFYLLCLGSQILKLVINKCLQKRVYTLIFSVLGFLPLRLLLLGLSVLTKPEDVLFEAFAFIGFFSLLCYSLVSMLILVYLPVSDSTALRNIHDRDLEERSGTISLIADPTYVELSRFCPNRDLSSSPGSPSFVG